MANHEIKEPMVFSVDLRKFETTDKAHANLFNAVAEVLINNDAFLYGIVEALTARMTQELAGKVPITRKVNNKELSADITLSAGDVSAIPANTKGAAGGVAELDGTGKVLAAQLPSFVDDVVDGYLSGGKMYKEATHKTVITEEAGKIYIDLHTNKTYRWSGTAYAVISDTVALGETSSTAYRGDRGKTAYDHSQSAHAPANAEQNVQSDWNVTDTASDAFIKNKPSKLPANGGNADTVNGKTVGVSVPADAKFTDTRYNNMVGATISAAGKAGLAPRPAAGAANRYLRSDGSWAVPPNDNTVYTHPTGDGNKHVPAGGLAGQFLKWSAAGTAVWAALVNNLLATVAGNPLDATQGKILDDKITALNGKLTRVQLYKSTGTNTLTIPNLNTYSTVIIYAMAGDYCVSVVAVRESSIKNFVLSTYHSATYNICGELTIDFSTGKITTSRTTGNGWGVDRLYIREVYGYK